MRACLSRSFVSRTRQSSFNSAPAISALSPATSLSNTTTSSRSYASTRQISGIRPEVLWVWLGKEGLRFHATFFEVSHDFRVVCSSSFQNAEFYA
ncbi:hypothetical protein BYT27DRAFT_7201235 [Phlegmacium glaucopus]|nr:hypothetical protein BYT27DRAFT_7201235 [Phlegmacium glaucopus]